MQDSLRIDADFVILDTVIVQDSIRIDADYIPINRIVADYAQDWCRFTFRSCLETFTFTYGYCQRLAF